MVKCSFCWSGDFHKMYPVIQAKMAKTSTFRVVLRWAAWSPITSLKDTEHTITLLGGPSPVPDRCFVFRQVQDGVDSSVSANQGTITFSFARDGERIIVSSCISYSEQCWLSFAVDLRIVPALLGTKVMITWQIRDVFQLFSCTLSGNLLFSWELFAPPQRKNNRTCFVGQTAKMCVCLFFSKTEKIFHQRFRIFICQTQWDQVHQAVKAVEPWQKSKWPADHPCHPGVQKLFLVLIFLLKYSQISV